MIVANNTQQQGLGELGFSLKPPKFIRDLVKTVVGGSGVKVTVPTPAGPIEVNRDTVQRAVDQASRATVTVGPREEIRPVSAASFVENKVPGGYAGLAIAGLLALLLLRRRGI